MGKSKNQPFLDLKNKKLNAVIIYRIVTDLNNIVTLHY